jgi:hypothetical protein
MEKTKLKRRRRAEKPALSVTGPLLMPSETLPWECDLLVVVLEAFKGLEQEEQETKPEATS